MIRVVLVDDQELVRAGLRALLERDGDIQVVAEASDGLDGIAAVRQERPDVVLMDLRMPRLDGAEATRRLLEDESLGSLRVIVLTTFDDDDAILTAIRAGASGFLLKDIAPDQLRGAVRAAADGDAPLAPAVARSVLSLLATTDSATERPDLVATLTEREVEVLTRIGLGESNDQLAEKLFISPATARTYVSRLLAKLGARDRAQLVVLAFDAGLVRPGQSRS